MSTRQPGAWNGHSIPASYKGHTFRSRLEARWAVFMDQLSVRWFYEYEGFELSCGWYVPDFWLPDLNRWLEIKPLGFNPDGEDSGAKKCQIFRTEIEGVHHSRLVVLCGSPSEQDDNVDERWYSNPSSYVDGDHHHLWCRCRSCGRYGIEFDGRGARICTNGRGCNGGDGDKGYSYDEPTIMAAKSISKAWSFH